MPLPWLLLLPERRESFCAQKKCANTIDVQIAPHQSNKTSHYNLNVSHRCFLMPKDYSLAGRKNLKSCNKLMRLIEKIRERRIGKCCKGSVQNLLLRASVRPQSPHPFSEEKNFSNSRKHLIADTKTQNFTCHRVRPYRQLPESQILTYLPPRHFTT
jgi:hypothetical protein